jgi:hypothetical protein
MYLFNGICSCSTSVLAVTFPMLAVLFSSARSIDAGVLFLKVGFGPLLLFPTGSTAIPLAISFFL